MTDFTFNTGIPAAGNNPSIDQPEMLNNNIQNAAIWNVDHIGFNALNGGTHTQLTFINNPNYLAPPVAPIANGAFIYTGQGTASTSAQTFFLNSQATFPMTSTRAFGVYPGSTMNGALVAINQFNITSVSRISAGVYAVTLAGNVITSTTYGVIATSTFNQQVGVIGIATYRIPSSTGGATFDLIFNTFPTGGQSDPSQFTFQVLQI